MRVLVVLIIGVMAWSAASLADRRVSAHVLEKTWRDADAVLAPKHFLELATQAQGYTVRLFRLLPNPERQRAVGKAWMMVELILFRCLLLWHGLPALGLALVTGVLEGLWARQSRRAVVEIHSPTLFRYSLASLAVVAAVLILWLLIPAAVPPRLVLLTGFAVSVLACRNLVIHAPTHF